MSVKALTWAFDRPIAGNEKVVLLALADHADEKGVCWPSIAKLSERSCVAERTVQRILGKLAEMGLIEVIPQADEKGRSSSNRYKLSMHGEGVNLSPPGDTDVTLEGVTGVTPYEPSKGTTNNPPIPPYDEGFAEFWAEYPKRSPNPFKPAKESYIRARKKVASHEEIMAGLRAYAKTRVGQDPHYTPQAVTWLNQHRWKDDNTVVKAQRTFENFV